MSKKFAALLAAIVVLSLSAVALAARGSVTVKSRGTILANLVSVSGAHGVVAGTVRDSATGNGAIVFPTVGYGKGQKSSFTAYSALGSIYGTAVSDNTPNANHTATISNGKVRITGGTGAYRSARGSGTFSGTQDLSTNRTVIHYQLKYSYRK